MTNAVFETGESHVIRNWFEELKRLVPAKD